MRLSSLAVIIIFVYKKNILTNAKYWIKQVTVSTHSSQGLGEFSKVGGKIPVPKKPLEKTLWVKCRKHQGEVDVRRASCSPQNVDFFLWKYATF